MTFWDLKCAQDWNQRGGGCTPASVLDRPEHLRRLMKSCATRSGLSKIFWRWCAVRKAGIYTRTGFQHVQGNRSQHRKSNNQVQEAHSPALLTQPLELFLVISDLKIWAVQLQAHCGQTLLI